LQLSAVDHLLSDPQSGLVSLNRQISGGKVLA
jgi:hypothetical protein